MKKEELYTKYKFNAAELKAMTKICLTDEDHLEEKFSSMSKKDRRTALLMLKLFLNAKDDE